MKGFYRRALVVPTALPSYVQAPVDQWDHSKPILSVIIPCYNYGRYIRETLQSLQSQTFRDFETIVVDDGSNEELTLRVLDDLPNEGIQVLRQEKLNVATALNLGISAARGRYVCRLDADDTIEPTYFEKCLCLLESNQGVAIAYSLVKTFGDENQIWLTEPFDLRLLLEYNHICAAAVFRRSVWEQVGGFDTAMDGFEDWEFWVRLGKAGFRGKLIAETLFNYRRHGTTLNIRSERRSGKLLDRIRTTHADLYSDPEQIREIQKSYRDIRVPNPFLNLSSKNQYQSSDGKQGVAIVSLRDSQATELLLHKITSELLPQDTFHFILITTDRVSYERNRSLREISSQAYPVDRFLDSYCWLEFVLNLIHTRTARFFLVSNSKPGYEWIPLIKARTSALVVDVVQDDAECSLSARYDQFIDLHVTFSRHITKSLVDEFGVPAKKICSFSRTPPLAENLDNLIEVLAQG